MVKKVPCLLFTVFAVGCAGGSRFNENDTPINPYVENEIKSVVIDDNMRIQLLDEGIFRFEYKDSKTKSFLNSNTFLIPNRDEFKGVFYCDVKEEADATYIKTDGNITITIKRQKDTKFRGISISRYEREIYNTDKDLKIDDIKNIGELPSPEKTPDVFPLVDAPRIILPTHGYNIASAKERGEQFKDTCGYEIQNGTADLYLLVPNRNPRILRDQYNRLAGRTEMVRLSTLGAWDSRYYEYNENTAQLEVDNYHKYNLPLDNLVIDTDWRIAEGGIGYDVNTNLFPDMKAFLGRMHNQNIEVCFNDHPEPVIIKEGGEEKRANVFNPKEVEYRQTSLTKLLDMGLDYWWYDRNWSTALISPIENQISHETFGDYLYNDVARQYNEEHKDIYGNTTRPTIMCNVNDVNSGNYYSIKDSASHRYSLQWTGDISPNGLNKEIANVIKTGINSIPYMSSDLSGHTAVASNEEYNRWIQYGALSPIFRIHCTRDLPIHCQPWFRDPNDDPSIGVMTNFRNNIDMRYRLLPYFYALSHENYESGMPLCRSIAFDNDVTGQASDYLLKEWMLGDNILFAPISTLTGNKCFEFNEGGMKAVFYPNIELKGTGVESEAIKTRTVFDFPRILELCPKKDSEGKDFPKEYYSAIFTGSISLDQNLKLGINVDDGARLYIKEKDAPDTSYELVIDAWKDQAETAYTSEKTFEPGDYDFKIEYYQKGNDAVLKFYKVVPGGSSVHSFYLPKGQWYDTVSGTVREGGQVYSDITYANNESPIFVKLGTVTPLVQTANNTKDIDWNKITFDVYPSNTSEPTTSSNFIYEDDFYSQAYKKGDYRLTPYTFTSSNKSSNLSISKANGSYIGSDFTKIKYCTFRIHCPDNKIPSIYLDDKLITNFKEIEQADTYVMPFSTNEGKAKGHKVIEVSAILDFTSSEHNLNFVNNIGE